MSGEYELTAFVAAEDYIYIGSPLPFNQKYFHMSTTKNAATSAVSVAIWNGTEFIAATDVVDRTATAGASLAKSGYISFRPDIDATTWSRQQKSSDVGLTGTAIYNMYWARFAWSVDLTALVDIKHMGHRFSTDTDIYGRYPALNDSTLQASFLTGSSNWDIQAFDAAEDIVNDLIERNIVNEGAQILDASRYKFPSVHKVAEIVFRGMGTPYEEQRKAASGAYSKSMNMKHYGVDLNKNAELDDKEAKGSGVQVMHR